jgi:rhodanese-related sulfurtransferase
MPAARWSSLSTNQKLAAVALGLGAVALFVRVDRGSRVSLDTKQLAAIIEKEDDHVTVSELAGWIIEGRSDYRLLDLRSAGEYAAYHIPTAENVPLSALVEAPLERTERVVLYSEGGIHASQAWMLMQARGFKSVYTLKGGLDEWKDQVLFPTLEADATPQAKARFERAVALAKFFGGAPRTAGGAKMATAAAPELPHMEAAAPPAGAPAPAKKKKKEGC